MLRVEYTDKGEWSFLPDVFRGELPPRLYVAFPGDRPWLDWVVFVTEHKVEVDDGIYLVCLKQCRDPTTGIRYELTPIEEEHND